ncbi:hypothetical protein CHUAL_011723 [Chamberlinius hualienensis]
MSKTSQYVIIFHLCFLILCDARLFQLTNSTNITSAEIESVTDGQQNYNWSSTSNYSVETTTMKTRRGNCFGYYEYCVNKTITYKFQTTLVGKRTSILSPDDIGPVRYKTTRCLCDSNCMKYSDCCYDKLQIDIVTGELTHLPNDTSLRWECRKVPIRTYENSTTKAKVNRLLVAASCPQNFDNESIIRRCHRQNVSSSQYHYSMDVPFLSRTTNITYSNMYCAICNNDTEFRKWDVKIYCPAEVANCTELKEDWVYVTRENRWTIFFNGTNFNITYELFIDTAGKSYYKAFNARMCRPDVIRDCPSSWTNNVDRALCSAYSLLVRSNDNRKIYKNQHCAVCNGQRLSADNIVCPGIIDITDKQGSSPMTTQSSYSILMDFFGDGNRVGETRTCGSESDVVCQYGEICDRIRNRCRPYTCGRKFTMNSDGECILSLSESDQIGNNTYFNDSFNPLPVLSQNCPKLFIHRPHYIDLANNSIYINATSVSYSATEHEFVNETTVLICTSNSIYNFGKFSKAQSILSTIGISISLIFLAIHIFIHLFVPQLRNLHGKNILSLSISLFLAQSFFEFGLNLSHSFPLCVTVGMTVHFGFLASFFWMNIMAIDVCRTFATNSYRPSSDNVWKEYKRYSLYAWLTPFVIVMMALTNDILGYIPQIKPLYAQPLCWINSRDALLVFFAGPLAVMLLENIIFFLLTVRGIYTMAKVAKIARINSTANGQGIANDRTRIILYAKLALIMGLTWIFSFIAALSNMEVMWYLFIMFNSVQGAFIFVAFSCKRKILRTAQDKFRSMFGEKRKTLRNKTDSNLTQSTKLLSMLSTSLHNLTRIKETTS